MNERIAGAELRQQPVGNALAILLRAMNSQWYNTAGGQYDRYLKQAVDTDIAANDSAAQRHNLADLGDPILLLNRVTQEDSYYVSATALCRQLLTAKSTSAEQASNTEPFLAEYAALFDRNGDYARIAEQVLKARREPGSRNLGFRMMMLIDALPYFPADSTERTELQSALRRMAVRVDRTKSGSSSLWSEGPQAYEPDKGCPDLAASAMITYSLARGVQLGLLPRRYEETAQQM